MINWNTASRNGQRSSSFRSPRARNPSCSSRVCWPSGRAWPRNSMTRWNKRSRVSLCSWTPRRSSTSAMRITRCTTWSWRGRSWPRARWRRDVRCGICAAALAQFDLAGALAASARQITSGTGVQAELETKGPARLLPEVVEENLLRIGQEALTNVIKHARANLAGIELEFGAEQVTLQIKDNGIGFAPEHAVGPNEGHFGLLGMSERAKRLEGHLKVWSEPGKGTAVRVEIPLEPPAQSNSAALAQAQYAYEEAREDSSSRS